MSYKIPASEFYSEHVCYLIGMFPSELVNSSNQIVLLLLSTLSYNGEPWNTGSDAKLLCSTKGVCLWNAGSWTGLLILTSHLISLQAFVSSLGKKKGKLINNDPLKVAGTQRAPTNHSIQPPFFSWYSRSYRSLEVKQFSLFTGEEIKAPNRWSLRQKTAAPHYSWDLVSGPSSTIVFLTWGSSRGRDSASR